MLLNPTHMFFLLELIDTLWNVNQDGGLLEHTVNVN